MAKSKRCARLEGLEKLAGCAHLVAKGYVNLHVKDRDPYKPNPVLTHPKTDGK